MKKIFATLSIMILSIGIANAQLSNLKFRVDSGVNFSKGDYKAESLKDITSKPVVGYRIGASVNIPFSMGFYFAPGLTFQSMGGQTSLENLANPFGKKAKATTRTHAIQIPLQVGIRIPVGATLAVNLQAGPYLSYALAGTTTVEVGGIKKEFDTFKDGVENMWKEKRFDVGLGAAAIVDINSWYGLLGADFGLMNQKDMNSKVNELFKDKDTTLKNTSFYLGVGYRF